MNAIHRIRLRGPWEVTAFEAPADVALPPSIKMSCPCSWRDGGWANFHGKALHKRNFGRPRQIDAHEQVWLAIDPCQGELTIELNGKPLGVAASGTPFEFDITQMLALRNALTIDVSGPDDACGLTGEVRLEIRTSDSGQ